MSAIAIMILGAIGFSIVVGIFLGRKLCGDFKRTSVEVLEDYKKIY